MTISLTASFMSSSVSKIARTIGRCLRLNEDLIEAIALGHDIGHIPYGHFGETCLSTLCEEQGIGKFFHNVQSIQFLDRIENCDLTMQVLDGILCHNGESDDVKIYKEPCRNWLEFDKKVQDNADGRRTKAPMTLEGCVVKFADTIAFIGRDLQDAREVGLISSVNSASPGVPGDSWGTPTGKLSISSSMTCLKTVTVKMRVISHTVLSVESALISLRTFSRDQYLRERKTYLRTRKSPTDVHYTVHELS